MQARMEDRNVDAMRDAWEDVAAVVTAQGLALATEVHL